MAASSTGVAASNAISFAQASVAAPQPPGRLARSVSGYGYGFTIVGIPLEGTTKYGCIYVKVHTAVGVPIIVICCQDDKRRTQVLPYKYYCMKMRGEVYST